MDPGNLQLTIHTRGDTHHEINNHHGCVLKWEQPSGDVFYITFSTSILAVERLVAVTTDRKWDITGNGKKQAPALHPELHDVPEILCSTLQADVIFKVANGNFCVGNPDYWEKLCIEGNVEVECEDKGPYVFKQRTYNTTIRPSTCSQLAASDKDRQCPGCSMYRADLASRRSYQKTIITTFDCLAPKASANGNVYIHINIQ